MIQSLFDTARRRVYISLPEHDARTTMFKLNLGDTPHRYAAHTVDQPYSHHIPTILPANSLHTPCILPVCFMPMPLMPPAYFVESRSYSMYAPLHGHSILHVYIPLILRRVFAFIITIHLVFAYDPSSSLSLSHTLSLSLTLYLSHCYQQKNNMCT